jgi:hypothetical protein
MADANTSTEVSALPRPEFLKLGDGFYGLAVLFYFVWTQSWSEFWFFVIIVAAILIVIIGNVPLASLAADVKKEVMGRLAGHFAFIYDPKPAKSDIHLFDELGLLPYRSNTSFEDGLSGEIKGVPFQMVEAHLTKRVKSGKNHKTVTVFRGLLLSVDAVTQIDDDELPVARLGDQGFEASYEIRAADRDAAQRLFDTRARRAVEKLAAREDVEDLRLGFVDGALIVAINRGSDSFEVTNLGRHLADPGRVQAMVEQFAILFDVVDEFGLQPPEKPADA